MNIVQSDAVLQFIIVQLKESVCLFKVSGFEPVPEPPDALGGSPVSKGVRNNLSLCLPLNSVVAYGVCGGEGFFHISGFQDIEALLGMVGPDSCEKIRLQFESDGQPVVLALGEPGVLLLDFIRDS